MAVGRSCSGVELRGKVSRPLVVVEMYWRSILDLCSAAMLLFVWCSSSSLMISALPGTKVLGKVVVVSGVSSTSILTVTVLSTRGACRGPKGRAGAGGEMGRGEGVSEGGEELVGDGSAVDSRVQGWRKVRSWGVSVSKR